MVAGDEESYVVFKDLFDPVISGEYKTGVSLMGFFKIDSDLWTFLSFYT